MGKNEFDNKSLLGNIWQINNVDERLVLSSSQKNDISPLLAKLLLLRNIDENLVSNFLLPDFKNNLPDPFLLNDMKKSVDRVIYALHFARILRPIFFKFTFFVSILIGIR